MGTLRTFGVRGKNLPVKRTQAVVASDFLIGGMLIEAERNYAVPFKVTSPEEFSEIFGNQIVATNYGFDAIKGFFDNAIGISPTLYIQTLVGYDTTGDVIDAVVASRDKIDDGSDADAYTVESAYQEYLEYGVSGNRTGTKFVQAERFITQASATCPATGQSYAVLDSVVGMRVGDLVLFKTNAGVDLVYKIVTMVSESESRIYWTGNFEVSGGSAESLAINDEVVIPGFMVKTYRKSISGIEVEVETELGQTICSSESAVQEFYVENIHASNRYVKITEASASTLEGRLPADDTSVVYPTNGADGTTVASVEAQAYYLEKFNDKPIRFLANPETTDTDMQKALETYSKSRTAEDNPLVIANIAENRTKAQLITIGNGFQRSDEVDIVIFANWLKVVDPFNTSQNAPYRSVPNVGHVMGACVRTIGTYGIHYVPATNQTVLYGVEGVVGDYFLDNRDRTDIAEAGVNLIQEKVGVGIKLANFRTPSTDTAYAFANGILMRNYIKISSVDSLQGSENTPNSINRVLADKMAILTFLYGLWFSGSTGDVPEGETFGQTQEEDGLSTPEDHFQVTVDPIKNSKANLALGKRDIDVNFTYPAPAESIVIGVGILLR